ncbi:MAG: endonuclease, partial [Candidatus Moranbacteria bacterium CG_4_9_14_3_um_filter_40_7]
MDFASYVSGFIDGEGCFSVSFNFREKLKTKIEVRPSFSIGQNMRSLEILKMIQKFFDCGSIRFCKNDQCYKYETRNIGDLR